MKLLIYEEGKTLEQLTALGTGYAVATKCYTTCFTISDGQEHFMIDTGGGNYVLTNLEKLGIAINQVHHIFLSHRHTDHIMGAVWMLRMVGHGIERGSYVGQLHMYCEEALTDGLIQMCKFMLPERLLPLFGEKIMFHCLSDGQKFDILGRQTTFFDTCSKKTKQFGLYTKLLNGKSFTYLGDEPFREECAAYAAEVDYLMHEAMCLQSQEAQYHPHPIQHSTVKDAAECAERLHVHNLILHHTEDEHLSQRKQLYTKEAELYFGGKVFVPDDLDVIVL